LARRSPGLAVTRPHASISIAPLLEDISASVSALDLVPDPMAHCLLDDLYPVPRAQGGKKD
jgi:hypothetical protein